MKTIFRRRLVRAITTKLGLVTAKVWLAIGMLVALVAMVILAVGVVLLAISEYLNSTSTLADSDIPTVALQAYQQAGNTGCDEVHWSILAGIGKVETNHGRHGGNELTPTGDTTNLILGPPLNGGGVGGNTTAIPVDRWAGKWGLKGKWQQGLGPMQFLPGTFAQYGPDGGTPHNIYDASTAASSLLCSVPTIGTDLEKSLRRYNNSATYVNEVIHWAALYRTSGGVASTDGNLLIGHPNVTLTTAATQDLENGIVDPRLISVLLSMAQDYSFSVLSFRTGHSRCKVLPNRVNTGPNCSVSNHWEGRAADVMKVSRSGQAPRNVTPRNAAAKEITRRWATTSRGDIVRPDEFGSPWNEFEGFHGHFANSLHQDHLHIGYHRPPPASFTESANKGEEQ